MTVKLEAAYHEAAHAVAAHFSSFHSVEEEIHLGEYGAGAASVGLNQQKCIAAGKPWNKLVERDKEVTKDFVAIMCAGLVGEELAAETNAEIIPNRESARPDHELAVEHLHNANLSKKLDRHLPQARKLLIDNWTLVERLSRFLFDKENG